VVPIPALLDHQHLSAYHPARFKLLCCGRRWGKDIEAFNVSWFGHGPDRVWPGIVDGWDVAWLAPDYPQAKSVWLQEILPRFDGVPGIALNETDHRVTIEGYGSLVLRSAENVTSLRGLGKRLIGVVVNEAAHLDLADAWRRVLRPLLMDNHGWAYLMSTPNRGTDGGKDEQGSPRVPSFFNALCEDVRLGKRGDDWAVWFGDARENPKIGGEEFHALVAEYPLDSVALQEEVYAQLLPPGTGLVFSEWRDAVHTVESVTVPPHWRWGAGYDWGYYQPSCLTIIAQDEDGSAVVMGERKWTQTTGYDMGKQMAETLEPYPVEYIACDSSMWGVQGQKGYPNLAEEVQGGIWEAWTGKAAAPNLVAVPKGPDSRIARAQLLHRYLKWVPAEDGSVKEPPRLRFLKRCAYLCASIPKLPPDPVKPEDVLTSADDHGYDSLTYYLMTRPQPADAPVVERPEGLHPGLAARYPHLAHRLTDQPVQPARPRFKPTGRMVRE
jgi:hypothetical protein